MAADLEWEARRLASARNHALVTCHAQGRHALGGEHVEPRLPLLLQAALDRRSSLVGGPLELLHLLPLAHPARLADYP